MTAHQQNTAWKCTKLGDLVSFKTGKLDSNAAKPDGAYPFFTCSRETFRTDTYSFDTECVLLAGNNANGVYPIKYYSGKFDAYQRTYVIRTLDEASLSNRYLYYALQPKLELMKSISTGAATKFLTLTLLRGLDLEVPPLPTQHKIASVLSTYDDLIENNTRRIEILEEMAQATYREWFVNFRYPGHEKVSMVESKLGRIPEGWEIESLAGIAQKRNSKYTETEHRDLPLLDLARIPRRSWAMSEFGDTNEISTSRITFSKDDILFGSIRPYFHKVVLAPVVGVTNVSVLVLRSVGEVPVSFLLSNLFSDATVDWASQHSTGTKMPVIKWDVLAKMPVIVPPPSLLGSFDELVTHLTH